VKAALFPAKTQSRKEESPAPQAPFKRLSGASRQRMIALSSLRLCVFAGNNAVATLRQRVRFG
jgi:hypothetical protein